MPDALAGQPESRMSAAEAFAPTTITPLAPETRPRDDDSRHSTMRATPANDPRGPGRKTRHKPKRPNRYVRLAKGLATNLLFWLTVVVPTGLSTAYFGWVASDIYVSESKFIVRMPQRQSQPSLMGALLQGSGFMRSQDDTFSVHEFMQSRDALQSLDDNLGLRAAFSDLQIDPLSRFPAPWSDSSFESLYKYYGGRVAVSFDAATSITTLRVNAFTSQDAHAINAKLLTLGESMVNQINTRGRNDLARFAQAEVDQAEARARDAALAVATFRNERAVFDPERQSALQLQSVMKLQEELGVARAQLAQVQAIAPDNPQVPSLRIRVQQAEIGVAAATARVMGGNGSLSNKSTDFERLNLDRAFADRQLASAMAALESARNEARRQQLYLERVVKPNQPDYAIEPRRVRNVLAALVIGLVLWGVLSLLLASVREHQR